MSPPRLLTTATLDFAGTPGVSTRQTDQIDHDLDNLNNLDHDLNHLDPSLRS